MPARRCRLILAVWLVQWAAAAVPAAGQDSSSLLLRLPSAFPIDRYTPHGYIDNPYHSMVTNRSGVIRSFPPLGFGWWRTDFHKGAYASGDRDHVNYISLLQMAVAIDERIFLTDHDFSAAGVTLSSLYHTKSLMSYDWAVDSVAVSLRYFLPSEHTLACQAVVRNGSSATRDIQLNPIHRYSIGGTRWWGSDGLTVRYDAAARASIGKIWAYGDVFAMGASAMPVAHYATESEARLSAWIRRDLPGSTLTAFVQGRGPLYAVQRHAFHLLPGEERAMLICLSRETNELRAITELASALRSAVDSARTQLAADATFWNACPTLQGDWPEAWKRGWVYDYETLRMTVRRPLGIFHHPWDGMQIHAPRAVLGETSMDMLALSYADPELAKLVLYGTFADAIAPNVPCVREDGSVNMISSDGSECGTAPMWGYPFQTLLSLYAMSHDTAWLGRIYPFLKDYALWWLEERTDEEGWLHCNNSWESGQDGSRRFLVAEQNEGAVADFVRTVDVEASMARALQILEKFATALNRQADAAEWGRLAERRVKNTQAMFTRGRYCDVDGRTGKPIVQKDSYDVMLLAPLTCGVSTPAHVTAIRPDIRKFAQSPPSALQWPPSLLTYTEAAWNAGERSSAANAVAAIADRVYRRTDARTITPGSDPLSYRIPGVANEYWPVRDLPPGGENYGWGATLPLFIIRNVFGFRETGDPADPAFMLAPCLPTRLLMGRGAYTISNLKFRGLELAVTLQAAGPVEVKASVRYEADRPVALTVIDQETGRQVVETSAQSNGVFVITGVNGHAYRVQVAQ